MNGWIIALCVLGGISVYVGIACLVYAILIKCGWVDDDDEDDAKSFAMGWIVTLPLLLVFNPFMLCTQLMQWLDKERQHDERNY